MNTLTTAAILLLCVNSSFTVEVSSFATPLVAKQRALHSPALLSSKSSDAAASASTFPVLGRIAGIEWTGDCRYVDAELVPAENLKLFGGLRYDIDEENDDTSPSSAVTLSSFLTFPNGQRREVVMKGTKGPGSKSSGPMKLESAAEGGGPIYMLLTELPPDTVLINEVETATGEIVMTSSLSVVTAYNSGASETEIVQVSHEVGGGDATAASKNKSIEGHQVWRLKKSKATKTIQGGEYDDFQDATRETTGR